MMASTGQPGHWEFTTPRSDQTAAETTATAAARTLAAAGLRAQAGREEIRAALHAVFAPIASAATITPSQIRNGTPLSAADKARIREQVAAGRDNAAIAADVGCSIQGVVGVRHSTKQRKGPTHA